MTRKRRNRKKDAESGVIVSPVAAILLGVAVLSLGYLWVCGRCDALGRQITALEVRKTALHRQVLKEDYKWSRMKSPRNIERLLARHGLSMQWPAERDVVRIHADAPGPLSSLSLEYAQHTGSIMND
jgi:hypothetical protein